MTAAKGFGVDILDVFGVNMPDELSEALLRGSLVIFAGAGVSKQPPCSLCTFEELVEGIADDVDPLRRCAPILENGESCEAALGRLSVEGDIYKTCAEKLVITTCSELHRNILSLFQGSDSVRVVTTNFDKGFSNASEELGLEPRLYEAPALPLGDSFDGVVHLHGSVDHPSEMVLTDSDFGKAYVSNGWAARFLVDMFSTYTVLFVGYSCGDMLVRYLARSISTEMKGNVFALEKSDGSFNKWQTLGIEPIKYDDYGQLPKIFAEWSRKTRLTLYERANAVRGMAALGDKLDEGSCMELKRFLSATSGDEFGALAKAYIADARGLGSLRTLSRIGYDGFMYEDEIPEEQFPFFDWAAKTAAAVDPCELLRFSTEKKQHFSKGFCRAILKCLAQKECDESRIAIWMAYFEPRWVASDAGWYHLFLLLEKVKGQELSLRLAKFAFSFFYEYSKGSFGCAEGIVVRPYFEAQYGITRMKEAIFLHFDAIGEELFGWMIGQFEEIARAESFLWTAERWFDRESFSRSSIEDHEQDSSETGTVNAMISIARDLGVALLEKGAKSATDFRALVGSKSDLVVRIGLFLMEKGGIDGDIAIETVVSDGCLDVLNAKHEVYSILKYAYPMASTLAREKLIAYVCEQKPEIDDRVDAHSRFSLFSYLLLGSPDDPLLIGQIEEVKRRFPNFELGAYPDLVYSIESGWEGDDSLFEITEADFAADSIIGRWRSLDKGESRFRFVQAVNDAMRKYPDKAISVCLDLISRDELETIAVDALYHIRWSELSTSLKMDAINLLSLSMRHVRLYPSSAYAIKELSELDGFLVDSDLESLINEGISRLREWLNDRDLARNYDWLTTSINCPLGQLITAVLNLSKSFDREGNLECRHMVSDTFANLLGLFDRDAAAIKCIAASLFSEANYWAGVLPEFFSSEIVPMLGGGIASQGAWCGLSYLGWVSGDAWKRIREYWQEVLLGADFEGDQEARRVRLLFFWASIQHDAPDLRDELFRASFKDPQACSCSTWVLSEWTLRLSGEERMREWNRWIKKTIGEALDSEEGYAKSARHVGRLLDDEENNDPDIAADAVRLLAGHCHWRCDQIIPIEEKLPQILENNKASSEDKALFLLAQLNSAHPSFSQDQWYRMAFDTIDCRSLKTKTLSQLRDAFVRHGFDVPGSMVGIGAF